MPNQQVLFLCFVVAAFVVLSVLRFLALVFIQIQRNFYAERVKFYTIGLINTGMMEPGEAKDLYLEVCQRLLRTEVDDSLLERRNRVQEMRPAQAQQWIIEQVQRQLAAYTEHLANAEETLRRLREPPQ